MKRLIFVFSVLATISTCSLLSAQDVGKVQPNGNADDIMLSDVPQTEGMWYYLHGLKRTDDPKMLVRLAAEKKGEVRGVHLELLVVGCAQPSGQSEFEQVDKGLDGLDLAEEHPSWPVFSSPVRQEISRDT